MYVCMCIYVCMYVCILNNSCQHAARPYKLCTRLDELDAQLLEAISVGHLLEVDCDHVGIWSQAVPEPKYMML